VIAVTGPSHIAPSGVDRGGLPLIQKGVLEHFPDSVSVPEILQGRRFLAGRANSAESGRDARSGKCETRDGNTRLPKLTEYKHG
jgi:hypothetical protein